MSEEDYSIEEDLEETKKCLKEANKEIERLKQDNEYLNKVNIELSTLNTSLRSDRDKYKNIIKEVREYIETHLDNNFKTEFDYITTNPQEILEILDKENNNEGN